MAIRVTLIWLLRVSAKQHCHRAVARAFGMLSLPHLVPAPGLCISPVGHAFLALCLCAYSSSACDLGLGPATRRTSLSPVLARSSRFPLASLISCISPLLESSFQRSALCHGLYVPNAPDGSMWSPQCPVAMALTTCHLVSGSLLLWSAPFLSTVSSDSE